MALRFDACKLVAAATDYNLTLLCGTLILDHPLLRTGDAAVDDANEANTWSRGNQRALLKGFTYEDVIVKLTDEGMYLTSASRPKYLDRLIYWNTITQTELKRLDRQYFIKEYWSWLMKLKDYTGLLPKLKNMIGLTFDDKIMMERNVHVTLNVDDETYDAVENCLGQLNISDEGSYVPGSQ
jgi:hypothetical protein